MLVFSYGAPFSHLDGKVYVDWYVTVSFVHEKLTIFRYIRKIAKIDY